LTIAMMLTIFLLGLFCKSALSDIASYTESFQVKVDKEKGTATCAIEISYSGDQLDASGSSVSCSLSGGFTSNAGKKKVINKVMSFTYTVGDLNVGLIGVQVGFKLSKAKNKPASKMQTQQKSFTASSLDVGEASYPSDLWCPQEDQIIYTASNSVVHEAGVASWQDCAQLCSEYRNEAGNAPCFSWTFNSGAAASLGLGAGVCRLLPYENVFRVDATDVQSGFHKCWAAYQTYSP